MLARYSLAPKIPSHNPRLGIDAALVKGRGYFYFTGIEYPSVYANAYIHLPVEMWQAELEALAVYVKAAKT